MRTGQASPPPWLIFVAALTASLITGPTADVRAQVRVQPVPTQPLPAQPRPSPPAPVPPRPAPAVPKPTPVPEAQVPPPGPVERAHPPDFVVPAAQVAYGRLYFTVRNDGLGAGPANATLYYSLTARYPDGTRTINSAVILPALAPGASVDFQPDPNQIFDQSGRNGLLDCRPWTTAELVVNPRGQIPEASIYNNNYYLRWGAASCAALVKIVGGAIQYQPPPSATWFASVGVFNMGNASTPGLRGIVSLWKITGPNRGVDLGTFAGQAGALVLGPGEQRAALVPLVPTSRLPRDFPRCVTASGAVDSTPSVAVDGSLTVWIYPEAWDGRSAAGGITMPYPDPSCTSPPPTPIGGRTTQ